MIGTKLAHYEITNHLGTGGMGEVYQAVDSKLGRSVAIKILPEAFSRDRDRIARFEREARLLASLNHPNIAGIFGLEDSGETRFLVLELIEGDTLAEKLRGGSIPPGESLKLALQIVHAVESAHEKGVIHRDIKPANIKITPEGKVKVLDFGLAKALSPDDRGMNLSNSPTISINPAPVVRFAFVLPDPTQLLTQPVSLLAISPDGTKIAYAANSQLYLRNLNETEARPIPGTNEGGTGPGTPVCSPDGKSLGYVQISSLSGPFSLKRVPVTGVTPVKLNEVPPGLRNFQHGLSWPTLDTMVYANADGIVKISANGGTPEVLVKRGLGESFGSPQMLPGGKQILFTRLPEEPGGTGVSRWDAAEIDIQSAGGNDRTVVWKGGSHARYLQSGHLIYALGNTVFAIPLDLTSRKVFQLNPSAPSD